MSWSDWASGVLQGLGAPLDALNLDTLWAWSGAESLPYDRMHINNPLNTTQPWSGATDWNTVGVKIYATESDGIGATVSTLLNGRYPTIVSHLRNSIPRAQWGDACPELNVWGTGCGWLDTDYGAVPGSTGGFLMALTDLEQEVLQWTLAVMSGREVATDAPLNVQPYLGKVVALPDVLALADAAAKQSVIAGFVIPALQDIQAKLAALPTSTGGLTAAQAQQLSDAGATLSRIETALRTA